MKSRPVLTNAVLRAGTNGHYLDARYYDHAYRHRREDVRFYVEEAKRSGGPVLELGVGTGRVALEIARAGIEIVGVDPVSAMLARGKARIEKCPLAVRDKITLRRGDVGSVRLGRRFPLVVAPFHVWMHLYDRAAFYRAMDTVAAHLTRDGVFIFDVLMPDVGSFMRDPNKRYRGRPVKHPENGEIFEYSETFEYDDVRQVQLVTMYFDHRTKPDRSYVVPLAHRQFFPEELLALLDASEFEVVARYGDFAKRAMTIQSDTQLIYARPRRWRRSLR